MKILAFGGSLRSGSFSKTILNESVKLTPENVKMEIFDIGQIPLFDQDYEKDMPEIVKNFKQIVKNADAILIVTPEYNYSIPGFLKNAMDWASRPYGDNAFEDKPAAIISCSTGMLGGSRAQYHLRQTLVFLNMHTINKPEVMIPFVDKKINNNELTDKETKDKIAGIIKALADWAERIKVK